MTHDYTEFAKRKWLDNCDERETFNEVKLGYHEYLNMFKSFLLAEYIKEKDKER